MARPLLLLAALAIAAPDEPTVLLTDDEIELAREFSPLESPPPDPTNRVADDPAAARLGRAFFFDPRFSRSGTISCATCHDPARGFSDGRRIAKGEAHHARHTQSLWNVAYNRWFFWDGRKDSLWSQALQPLEDHREHGTTRLEVVHAVAADEGYARAYEDVFGPLPPLDDEARFPPAGRPMPEEPRHPHHVAWTGMADEDRDAVTRTFVNLGKAIAAFERTLVTRRAPFDVFVEGLATGDEEKLRAIPPAAQRGFSLFVGEGRCILCHDGPNFTDREFHANRVPTGEGVDPGRALGVLRLLDDPFNLRSPHADDGGELGRTKLSLPRPKWHLPGEFKTPSLRNVATSPPYMHEGQMETLQEVVEFYSTLEGAVPPGPHTEKLLRPLGLDARGKADLVAFLESLTEETIPDALRGPPPTPDLPRDGR